MTKREAIEHILSYDDPAGFFVVGVTQEDLAARVGKNSYEEFVSRSFEARESSLSRTADIMCDEYENEGFGISFISAFLEADSLEDGEEPYND